MKNIAIFVGGSGEAALRIVRLFNEGNRLKTVLVVTDETAPGLSEKIADKEVEVLNVPHSEWLAKSQEISQLLRAKEVKLLVLDGFQEVISDEIMEAVEGEMVRVTSPELAPREVVQALEADLRRPVETPAEDKPEEKDSSPESEWAEALKINYRPPKIPNTPPEIPREPFSENPEETFTENPRETFSESPHRNPFRDPFREHREEERPQEPMPSTWLIWSILVTVFCCFIPGIVAIVFSSQVTAKYYANDIEGARRASRNAEIWIIVSFVLGVLTATLYLPFMFIG